MIEKTVEAWVTGQFSEILLRLLNARQVQATLLELIRQNRDRVLHHPLARGGIRGQALQSASEHGTTRNLASQSPATSYWPLVASSPKFRLACRELGSRSGTEQ